jgi:hypothetical protein
VRDLIEEVISIQGELLEFFAIIYLENGIYPKAMVRARFCSDDGMFGYQTNSSIDTLRQTIHRIAGTIAMFYGYDMRVTTVADLMDTRCYAGLLQEMQAERELQRGARAVAVCLN